MSFVGLTTAEAKRRLSSVGENRLATEGKTSAWGIVREQIMSPLIALLVGACVVSAALGEIGDAIAIGAIVVINGVIGFLQEYRAERALEALRNVTAPHARVLRDGIVREIPAVEVVPGDALVLEEGDVVAADGRLVEVTALRTNEALLTGESLPVDKSLAPSRDDAPIAERTDRIFGGTAVAAGRGVAEVTATGMRSELGKIAGLLASAESGETPLQKRLERVARTLLYLCVGIVAVVAVLGIVRGGGPLPVFLTAVALAVAAVPEGLPAVVTIALGVGVQRMAARNALVRKLAAVETLGCATVICTDKTGTLTTGVMTVREVWAHDRRKVLAAAAACVDAEISESAARGDPTEIAILRAAADTGVDRSDIERANPRVAVHPFDSDRKRMSILRRDAVLYVKGAVEVILPRCTSGVEGAAEANADMAGRGQRVLAVAVGTHDDERDLELLGLVGLADPPRSEAIEAVAAARAAGIKTVMITGDHPATARAIAREMGILRAGDDPDEVVRARVAPADKLAIVRALKAKGEVVAMTGDGANDAPALREANIGVAMGKGGTEVAREAASIVLTDDDYATIVAAVREGRGIFDNIRKTLLYLLSGNFGELLVMLVASVAGLPLPLTPLQLLWINLVTDGLPALALAMDPVEPDVLQRPPRRPSEPILRRDEWWSIAGTGTLIATITLGAFAWAIRDRGLEEARNLAFSILVFGEVLRAFAARSTTRTFWEAGVLTNVRLLAIIVASMTAQLAIHHIPATQRLFRIGAISLGDCVLSVALGCLPLAALEAAKIVRRSWAHHPPRTLPT